MHRAFDREDGRPENCSFHSLPLSLGLGRRNRLRPSFLRHDAHRMPASRSAMHRPVGWLLIVLILAAPTGGGEVTAAEIMTPLERVVTNPNSCDVRFWHLADMHADTDHVRY